jgi:hypothetical protein
MRFIRFAKHCFGGHVYDGYTEFVSVNLHSGNKFGNITIDIKTDLRGRVCHGVKYFRHVQDSCECSNEVAGSPRGVKFIDQTSE